MSRNIYDIFNERKNGLDTLVEGAEFEIEEGFESVEEAAYAMEDIIRENANDCIDFQAASYLEDLVLENLMFNAFDPESSSELIEESLKSRAEGIIQRLKKAWDRVKEWFAKILHTIGTALGRTSEWIWNNEDKIKEAIPKCQIVVKMANYHSFPKGLQNLQKTIDNIASMANNVNISKEVMLKKIGAGERAGVPEVVKKCFLAGGEEKVKVSQHHPNVVIAWAGCKNDFIDQINKFKKDTDKRFAEIISMIEKSGDESEKAAKLYDNFVFANGIIDTMTSNAITIVKKGCSDHFQLARKAVSKMNVAVNAKNAAVGAVKNAIVGESYEADEDFDEYLEEGFGNKFKKMDVAELEEKIEQLKAAVADIEEGNGPKKFLKKAKSELKDAQAALAGKNKKADKEAAKAAKKEEKAAKKAAKKGIVPAAEAFMVDFDNEIEFEDEE